MSPRHHNERATTTVSFVQKVHSQVTTSMAENLVRVYGCVSLAQYGKLSYKLIN